MRSPLAPGQAESYCQAHWGSPATRASARTRPAVQTRRSQLYAPAPPLLALCRQRDLLARITAEVEPAEPLLPGGGRSLRADEDSGRRTTPVEPRRVVVLP